MVGLAAERAEMVYHSFPNAAYSYLRAHVVLQSMVKQLCIDKLIDKQDPQTGILTPVPAFSGIQDSGLSS